MERVSLVQECVEFLLYCLFCIFYIYINYTHTWCVEASELEDLITSERCVNIRVVHMLKQPIHRTLYIQPTLPLKKDKKEKEKREKEKKGDGEK